MASSAAICSRERSVSATSISLRSLCLSQPYWLMSEAWRLVGTLTCTGLPDEFISSVQGAAGSTWTNGTSVHLQFFCFNVFVTLLFTCVIQVDQYLQTIKYKLITSRTMKSQICTPLRQLSATLMCSTALSSVENYTCYMPDSSHPSSFIHSNDYVKCRNYEGDH